MPFNAQLQKPLSKRKVVPEIGTGLTTRELREKNLLSMVRRIKPNVPKALKKMVGLMARENPDSTLNPDSIRLLASKFVIDFYLDLVKSLYKQEYDDEQGVDIQRSAAYRVEGSNVVQLQDKVEAPEGDVQTNKQLRARQLLLLTRKFKPNLAEALRTLNELIEAEKSAPVVRYSASKFLIETSKKLTTDIYKDKYDEEEGEEIEQDIAPVFSLTMLRTENTNKKDE
jgi:hypothetical protein